MNPQVAYLLNLSIQNIQSNQLNEAENYLLHALKIEPKNADALCFLSVIAAYRADYTAALKLINKSIDAFAPNAVAHSNKGNILKELGYHAEALMSFDRAISLEPNYAEAYSNKGNALQELGRYQDAIAVYDKAISLEPNYAEAYSNKGNALQELGRFDEAMLWYQQSLSINAGSPSTWNNVGVAHRRLKNYQQAFECQERALQISPEYADAWCNRGSTAYALFDYVAAVKYFDKALSLKPDYAGAYADKGNVLERLGQYEEALFCFQKAHALKPSLEYLPGSILYTKLKMALWDGLDKDYENVIRGLDKNEKSTLVFPVLSFSNSPEINHQAAQAFINAQHLPKVILQPLEKKTHQKIRIGYFSADFRDHPVSLLTAELFELHDREKFEIYAFSLRSAIKGDKVELRLRKAFDHFLDLEGKTDVQVAQIARDCEIDIAVDLGGHTELSPIGVFSYRAAPIQVGYLGFAGSTGASYMDYIVADKTIIPESSRMHYTEKVVYLPNTFMVDDSKRVPSSRPITRTEYGLPDDHFIFCCFNNSYKFNKKILESWTRVLLKVDKSIFWISENTALFRENILKEFKKLGVGPERIIFSQRVDSMEDHLARYALADLFLDTNPYNAHTTAVDALKAGLPLVTCLGETFPGRVAGSLLRSVGIPELVTQNMGEYERLAIELATHTEKLRDIRIRLIKNRFTTPLFDTQLYAKNIESAYLEMYKRYLNAEPVDHLFV
ncbi:tetratricopeptide repeat protein [Polynucleobacter sp. MG-5-Ahmo-C2]|uniref:tetratricopeptide repeat protein n=1 Tax=Polynucleobacter sp. MG-5-Ahmo-C2 TaxID=2081051 RepID=UPI001BFDAF26|nr:tetratricopeptide repeat protein [Polynucleobacter sp. MG-5-Ahmo-C2]QWD98261.1 tetratricopeptide repeat protein [Polynucleobacter sp. MG-5-Ahmo-C2]